MTIVKTKSRNKVYYQVRNGNKVVKHLGTEENILKVFQYYEENTKIKKYTESKLY